MREGHSHTGKCTLGKIHEQTCRPRVADGNPLNGYAGADGRQKNLGSTNSDRNPVEPDPDEKKREPWLLVDPRIAVDGLAEFERLLLSRDRGSTKRVGPIHFL